VAASARAARHLATAAVLLAAACAEAPQLEELPPPTTAAVDPTLTLVSAAVVSGRVVVTFTITDGGAPVSLATAKALSPSWTLAWLDKEPVSLNTAWRSLLLTGSATIPSLPPAGPGTPSAEVLANQKQPGGETTGTLAEPVAGSGVFTYGYAGLLPTDFVPPSGVNAGARLRVGAYLRGVAAGNERTATTLDFAPSGAVLAPYGVVQEENCRSCHAILRMHGGRITGADLCVTCHTWQLADPDTMDPAAMAPATKGTFPNPLELGRMVHRIHRGKKLPTLFLASSSATWPAMPFTAAPPLPYLNGRNAVAAVGTKYAVIGNRSTEYVFGRIASRIDNFQPAKTMAEGVGYPQDLRNCDACHAGAPDAAVIGRSTSASVRISRRACSGCHPDVFYGDPNDALVVTPDSTHFAHTGGKQVDDTLCADCHVRDCPTVDPAGCGTRKLQAPIAEIHRPLNDRVTTGSPRWSRVTAQIVGVTNAKAGTAPTVTFKVFDRSGGLNPLNTTALETPSATSSPVPRGMTGFSIILSGPITDYVTRNAVLRESPPLTSVPDGSGVFTYAFTNKLPADASGTWAIALEGRRAARPAWWLATDTFGWPYTGESVSEYPSNEVKYLDVASGSLTSDPARARRAVVSQAKCEKCHLELNIHGANRHDVAHCLLCHAPDATDWDKRPRDTRTSTDPGGPGTGMVLLNDPVDPLATLKRWGYATLDGLEERSIHLKTMTHRIHVGEREGAASLEGIRPFVIYGYGGATSPPNGYFFDDIRFPGDLANCETCHLPGTWTIESIPAGALGTMAERANISHTGTSTTPATAAHATSEAKVLPVAATCLSCHTSGAAVDHAAGKTSGGVEQCSTCHGESGADSVRKWHSVP
jgi:OmcA/MtrC family decaheme c-type cytochrome